MQKHQQEATKEASLPAVRLKQGRDPGGMIDPSPLSATTLGCEPLSGVNLIRKQELWDFS